MRGRLIFPFIAELHRLDTQAMAPDYDEDFKEPIPVDTDDDGVGEPFRREHPPVRVPCQVDPEALKPAHGDRLGTRPGRASTWSSTQGSEWLGLADAASATP